MLKKGAWTIVVILSGYYLFRALNYRFFTPGQLGPDLFNKQFWFFSHLAFALPVLVGGPLQFITKLRDTRPTLHRNLGRVYVAGASFAALTAIYLGATIELEGSRLPIVILGCLWLFFTLSAWRCGVNGNFVSHRLFMIRSYGLALVLVWLRLLGDIPEDILFFYIKDPAIRDATLEWMSWVIPLLVLEFWLSWQPLLRGRKV